MLTSVIQLLMFSLIPFIVYLFGAKTARGFLRDIGIYRPEKRTVAYVLLASAVMLVVMLVSFYAAGVDEMFNDEDTVIGGLRAAGLSLETVTALLVIAWIKTSLSEEILFRGFIAKRLIRRFGFRAGNLLQAVVFGGVHGLLILTSADVYTGWWLALVILLTGAAGWILGWIKEKRGNGSVIPGWIAHGLGNTVGFFLGAFVL